MRLRWLPLAAAVILLTHISHHCVKSAGQVQIRLVSFTNPDSLLADGGRCCRTPNTADDATCTGPCRTFFRVCAAADGAGIPPQSRVRLSRISRPRSSRGRRSPIPVSQQHTDTAVPSGLPSIGEQEDLLPAEHRAAQEPSRGTSIQVIHHLISTAEEEPSRGASPAAPTGRSTAGDSEPQAFPLEESADLSEDPVSSDSPVVEEDPAGKNATTGRPPLEGSALVGRLSSQRQPVDPQDIGLVFVEDKDYIHLYFQPKRPRTRRRANGGSAGDPPRHKQPPSDRRQRRSVRTAIFDPDTFASLEKTTESDDLRPGVGDPEALAEPGEVSGSAVSQEKQQQEEEMRSVSVESTPTWSGEDAREQGAAPQTTAECPLGVLFTEVMVTNGSRQSAGQYNFPFDTPWPGRLILTVEAWHDVTGDLDPSAADFSSPSLDVSARMIGRADVRRPLAAGSWSEDVVSAGPARVEVQTRVLCSPGSDRPHCATACDMTAGGRGQWRCLEDGSVTCQAGWRGPECDQPVCRAGCSSHTGYCRVPGECLCKIGYDGGLCSKCVPLPGCRHGYCKRSFECRCREGWTGLFCNKPICAKGCDKERGYCTEPDECRCVPGWRGRRCDRCERLPGCRQGSCVGPLECRCRPGWTGFLCERAICREGCSKQHGSCERPDVCRCELGWRGPLCDACLPYPGCLHGNCTEPWECTCQPGWTGFLCDKPVEPCSHQTDLCENGGTCETVLEEGLPAARCLCAAGYGGATCEESNALQLPAVATSRSIASSGGGGGGGASSSSLSSGGSRWPWARPAIPLQLGSVDPEPLLPPWRRRRSPGARVGSGASAGLHAP